MSLKVALLSVVVLLFAPAVFADLEEKALAVQAAARRLECKAGDAQKEVMEATTDMTKAGTDCDKLVSARDKMQKALDDAGCGEEEQFKASMKGLNDALDQHGCDTSGASPRFLASLVSLPLLAAIASIGFH